MTTSTFNRKKDRAIATKLITGEEWRSCLEAAKEARGCLIEGDLDLEGDDEGDPEF